jgi:hypothetical protein
MFAQRAKELCYSVVLPECLLYAVRLHTLVFLRAGRDCLSAGRCKSHFVGQRCHRAVQPVLFVVQTLVVELEVEISLVTMTHMVTGMDIREHHPFH